MSKWLLFLSAVVAIGSAIYLLPCWLGDYIPEPGDSKILKFSLYFSPIALDCPEKVWQATLWTLAGQKPLGVGDFDWEDVQSAGVFSLMCAHCSYAIAFYVISYSCYETMQVVFSLRGFSIAELLAWGCRVVSTLASVFWCHRVVGCGNWQIVKNLVSRAALGVYGVASDTWESSKLLIGFVKPIGEVEPASLVNAVYERLPQKGVDQIVTRYLNGGLD